ncbi:hypothetical protein ACET3Z_026880 [Daucus carota]
MGLGNFEEAIEQLKKVQGLAVSSLAIKVAAIQAHLELGQCLQIYAYNLWNLSNWKMAAVMEMDYWMLVLRQCCLIIWRIPSWLMPSKISQCQRKYFEKVIQGVSETTDLSDPHNLAAGNMILEGALMAATCSLRQLEAHLGNFAEAAETLSAGLSRIEVRSSWTQMVAAG